MTDFNAKLIAFALFGCFLFYTDSRAEERDQNTQALVRYYEILNIPKPLLPRTGNDFLQHRDEIREKFLKATGLFPLPERVPLDPQYSEPLDHPWCKVYKVAYQIWPDIYSVGLLFVPKELPPGKVPGILCPHGHFANGYYNETVQSRCLGLARLGFIVFSTPNDHYEDIPLGISNQTHQIWRNIRGLDFLQSLSEVDPERLGACGCSGGGTQVQMLIAIDDRVKAATIAGMTCDYREISFMTWQCCDCNYFPDVMRFTDQPELSSLGIPCPVQYLTMNDWTKSFERTTFPQVKSLYAANGYADLAECRYEATGHEYGRVKREWTYWWMDKHLRNGTIAENGTEPEELYLFDLKTLQDHKIAIPGKPLSALSDIYAVHNLKPDVDALRKMLGVDYALPPQQQEVQILSETIPDGVTIRKALIPGEGPLHIPATVLAKHNARKPESVAILLDQGEVPQSLLEAGYLIVVPDIRFIGSMSFDLLADGKGNQYRTFIPCDPDYVSISNDIRTSADARNAWYRNGLWWGRPLTGMSVTDIDFVVEYAKKQCSNANPKEIRLVAKNSDELAVAALFAALLNPSITKLDTDLDGVSYKNGTLPLVAGILRYGDIAQWSDLFKQLNTVSSDEIVKDWMEQDVRFRETNKTSVAYSPEHIRAIVDSAIALAERIKTIPDADGAKLSAIVESLRLLDIGTQPSESLYREVRKLKREIVRCNPHLTKLDKLLFLKKHDANDSQFHMCDQFYGFTAASGGGLYVLENPLGDEPRLVDLLEHSVVEKGKMKGRKLQGGAFLSPEVSFDGKTIYFAWCEAKPSDPSWLNEKSVNYYHEWSETTCYHLFRCNADGSGLVQLTDGSVNDFDPCELPDGRIAFISERRGGFLRCGRYCPTYTLFSMEPDGSDIVCLSYHETHEWQPSVENNGMLVYTRWDYVDRDTNVAHHIWNCFPDGRDPRSFHGNYPDKRERRPWMEMDIRAIPGSHRYVAVTGAHHGHAFGSLVLIDLQLDDDNAMSQLTRLTPEVPFPEAEANPREQMIYGTPWPFSEDDYLCVYDSKAKNRGIYWIDAAGNKELIYRDPEISAHSPIPLAARPRPFVIPTQTTQISRYRTGNETGNEPGTVGISNIYESDFDWPKVDGKTVKITALRVVELFAKSTPVPDDPRIGIAAQTNARGVLGTVPVEEDGSAFFEVPFGKPIYFQALDEQGRAVQSMRSATYLHPGEQLTCIGCHENKRSAHQSPVIGLAFQRPPSPLQRDVSGSYPLNFPQLVQPVLDAKCVHCHGEQDSPLAVGLPVKHGFDLRGIADAPNGWTRSYNNLAKNYGFYFHTTNGSINDPLHGGVRTTAGQFGAMAAPLQPFLTPQHHGVELSPEELYRVNLWLDTNSVFYGTYENSRIQAHGKTVKPSLE
ncbi:MAG: hypothetical protein FWC43_03615 [Planctomycetaceae bacterium]|nr:hypothetical protein [Planctomycetaceae bacterium]